MSSPSVGGLAVICDARLESSAKLRLGKTIVRLARASGPNKGAFLLAALLVLVGSVAAAQAAAVGGGAGHVSDSMGNTGPRVLRRRPGRRRLQEAEQNTEPASPVAANSTDSPACLRSPQPQCIGKLNAFDPFASSWSVHGFVDPDKPRADPEGAHTDEAREGAVRACLSQNNKNCHPGDALGVCRAAQKQINLLGLRERMASARCMKMVAKSRQPGLAPLLPRYTSCAVVGNGPGFKTGTNKSAIIDSYDAVFRSNYFASTDLQGLRTTWRTVNHKRSVSTGKPIVHTWLPRNVTYAGHALLMGAGEDPGGDAKKLIQRMGLGSNAYIVSAKCRGVIRGMVTKITKFMMATKALAATSHKDNQVTSGMWNIFLAMFLCEDVDLYGFSTHTVLPGTTKAHVVETFVSDRMSPYHNWGAQQAVVRYLVAARQVDLC